MIQMIHDKTLVTYEVIVNEKVEVICKMHCELHHLPYDPKHFVNECTNEFGMINQYFRTGNIEELYRYYFELLPKLNSSIYEKELEILKKYMNEVFDVKVVKIESIENLIKKHQNEKELVQFIFTSATKMNEYYQACKYLPLVREKDRPFQKKLLKNMI